MSLRLPARLARAWRAQPGLPGGRLSLVVLYGACAMVLALLGAKLWRNALQPVAAHDALNYLSEALYFLDVRGLAGMLGMADAADGSVRGSTHGFLFSAMLAGALSFTGPSTAVDFRNPLTFGKLGDDPRTASLGGQPLMNITVMMQF